MQEISFHVNRGEIVAIVGENGSGKTTLAKCLLGLYTPQAGSIYYDGIDVSTSPRQRLHARTAALFQDFVQYELTVRENIAFGDISRLHDEVALWDAIRAAQLESVVERLQDGLDSQLGVMFGSGTELSLGQWQRIALARLFFKHADIVLLDEPTAALDPQSELHLFQRVKEVYRKDRIVFLISHRLGICREVDQILVLQNGRLVESGPHSVLMAKNGAYARLFRMQAELYADSPGDPPTSRLLPTVAED